MKLIIDLIFIAILVVCGWSGYKKGIIMGIGGLLVIIISLYGGHLLSTTFSYEVIPALKPFVSGYLEAKVSTGLYDALGYEADDNGEYDVELSVHDLFEQYPQQRQAVVKNAYKSLGVYDATATQMAEEAEEYADEYGAEMSDGAIYVFCQRFTYYLGLILGFALVAIVLTVVGNLLNIGFKFPALDIINGIGGAAIGLLTGMCFCIVLAWVFRFTGKLLPEDTLETTRVASWFLEHDYLAQYLHF